MRRNFLLGLLICLAPTLLAAAFVGRGLWREQNGEIGFRRGIDLAGGTILVYEVNVEKTLARKGLDASAGADAATGLSSDDIKKLAENLKRRIDPNDLKGVIVRPVGTTRVEIILPYGGAKTAASAGDAADASKAAVTEDFVQEVKGLVRQVGVLEFRILANPLDDKAGMDEARAVIDRAKADVDAKGDNLLTRLAKAGLPPPAPQDKFSVTVNGTTDDNVTYQWVELAPEERESLGLSNAYAEAPPRSRRTVNGQAVRPTHLYPEVAKARGGVWPPPGDPTFDGLIYSREFIKQAPTKEEANKKVEYFLLTRVSPSDALTVDRDIGLTAAVDTDPTSLEPVVAFRLNALGGSRFGKITSRNVAPNKKANDGTFSRKLAVVLDDKIVSAPGLQSAIRDSGQITGFDQAGVIRLVYLLRSGALNAELKPEPVSENTVGATLGQDTITRGLWAVGLSFAAVMAFMVVYYRFAGGVACVALLANLLLTVGFMVVVNAAFTLPGLAGIVLMLGMAVDANVLIYERLREERAKGANLASAIRLGYDRALPTIIDTHLTSIFTALVLYAFGNDNLKGFAVSLTVGLVISLFTALYMTRLIFDYAIHKRWLTDLRMMQLFARPNFNPMKYRYALFTITTALTVLGLGLFLYRGEKGLNVDFTKGTVYGGSLVPGQERALSKTGDGKAGLLDLLAEPRQDERLKVAEVVPMAAVVADPDAPDAAKPTAEYTYKIKYADGQEALVTLANKPEGADEAAQLADVKARASHLPDYSVEQVYLSGDNYPDGKSRQFTVRTTEKEKELVQVSLDRLLRDDDGTQLLAAPKVLGVKFAGPTAEITLDRPASPGYFQEFLVRELRLAGRAPTVGKVPTAEVTGIPTEGDPAAFQQEVRTGRFTKLKVDVSKNTEFKALVDNGPKKAEEERVFAAAVNAAKATVEVRPLPDRLEIFDPALAAATRNQALYAILASWAAILAYLWFRFGSWTFGLAAVLCLIHDLCFTLGCIAVCHYLYDNPLGRLLLLHDFKIDLATVAALLTLVGYSVNDTIVVFDRIREVRGKNPLLTPQMINDSVNQTLSRTVLASLTVFLVVGVLYLFGGEGVHLFAFVMVVGVIVGTYSSIFVASPLLLFLGEGTPKTAADRAALAAATPATTA